MYYSAAHYNQVIKHGENLMGSKTVTLLEMLETCMPRKTILKLSVQGSEEFYAIFLSLRGDKYSFQYWRNDGTKSWSVPVDDPNIPGVTRAAIVVVEDVGDISPAQVVSRLNTQAGHSWAIAWPSDHLNLTLVEEEPVQPNP